jgi:16S rRNA (adenine1518-N6/adenine1519-N6)-dimethyltransferase
VSRGGRRAKKSLSQNFLVDPSLQRKIISFIDPQPEDRVLEIGPGQGALTQHLALAVGHLTVIELDDELAAELQQSYESRDDVEVIHGDALDLSIPEIVGDLPLKVIGNIPYGITTPIIFHLLDQRPRPVLIVLTVQKEVARRLAAKPGSKEYGALTVGVQAVARVEPLFTINRAAFQPRPKVDSMCVRIVPQSPPPLTLEQEAALRTLTRAAFQRRRKQLQKVLRQAPEFSLSGEAVAAILETLGIDPATRPDALSVPDYIRLGDALAGAA